MKQGTLLIAITISCATANSYVTADDYVKGRALRATMLNKGENIFEKYFDEQDALGLVEVFPREDSSNRSAESIRIEEGQAIRWQVDDAEEMGTERIPVRSCRGVLGTRQRNDLGLTFLQGNIRLKESVSSVDLKRPTSSWIEVIPEQSGVSLRQVIPVTLVAPGNYRFFGDSGQVIPAETKVDSYLFHFRSAQRPPVQGVIKFDQEIVGLICEADQLAVSDSIVGRDGMSYPVASGQYRGLEPHTLRFETPNPDEFRPMHFTYSADGRYLYFTDWVKLSHPVHGHRRICELNSSSRSRSSHRQTDHQCMSCQ